MVGDKLLSRVDLLWAEAEVAKPREIAKNTSEASEILIMGSSLLAHIRKLSKKRGEYHRVDLQRGSAERGTSTGQRCLQTN